MPLLSDSSLPKNSATDITENNATKVAINNSAILDNTYKQYANTLLQYTTGAPIIVDYYSTIQTNLNDQTGSTNILSSVGEVFKNTHLIKNAELKLESPFEYSYNEDNTISSVVGTVLIYPGFQTSISDLFLYKLLDGSIGIFEITSAPPLSSERYAYRRASVMLKTIATDELMRRLNESIVDTYYFDKAKYFTSTFSVLTEKSHNTLKTLNTLYHKLLKRYLYLYLKDESEGILELHVKDSKNNKLPVIYDPLLTEFINRTTQLSDTKVKIKQLIVKVDEYYKNTIWYLLSDDFDLYVDFLKCHRKELLQDIVRQDIFTTLLANRPYQMAIYDEDDPLPPHGKVKKVDEEDYYILSKAFYEGTLGDEQDDDSEAIKFERFLTNVINNKGIVDVDSFIDSYLNKCWELPKEITYYRVPIYLALIKIAINQITY